MATDGALQCMHFTTTGCKLSVYNPVSSCVPVLCGSHFLSSTGGSALKDGKDILGCPSCRIIFNCLGNSPHELENLSKRGVGSLLAVTLLQDVERHLLFRCLMAACGSDPLFKSLWMRHHTSAVNF